MVASPEGPPTEGAEGVGGPSELEKALAEYSSEGDEDEFQSCIVCKQGIKADSDDIMGVYVYSKKLPV